MTMETLTQFSLRLTDYAAYLAELDRLRPAPDPGEQSPTDTGPSAEKSNRNRFPRYAAGDRFVDAEDWPCPKMVVIPPGEFWMGAISTDPDRRSDEGPRRLIRISSPLAISITLITFDHWDGSFADGGTRYRPDDRRWGRDSRPVINVSWYDTEEYIGWLNRKLGMPEDQRYRLLSETEWEYAARAGIDATRFPWGDDLDARQVQHHAWCYNNSDGRPQPVGQKPANEFGLNDMLGNVAEWVQDHYSADYRPHSGNGQPYTTGSKYDRRVLRGGSWLDRANKLRPTARDSMSPDHRSYSIGFRIARNIP